MPGKTVSVRLKADVYAKLEELCRVSGHTPGGVVRGLILVAEANPQPPFQLTGMPVLEAADPGGRPRKVR